MSLPSPAALKTIAIAGSGFFGGMLMSSIFGSAPEQQKPPIVVAEASPTPPAPKHTPVTTTPPVSPPTETQKASIPVEQTSLPVDQTLENAWKKVVGKSGVDYSSNGEVANRIASVTPYFPFKGIPKFYDIGGFLKDPEAFQMAIDVFVERYRDQNIDSIAGFDARGFILGPPIALALKKPFIMLRKKGKMPNAITGSEYSKEYAGNDALSIPRGSINKGDRVLLIDDLVATGGTLIAGIELVKGMGGIPVEAACVVELKFLDARKKFEDNNHSDVPIWALMDEEILTLDGLASDIPTDGYVDDGEAH